MSGSGPFRCLKGGNVQDDRGRGDESGAIAPARLHQTCMRSTSPPTPLALLTVLAAHDSTGQDHKSSPQHRSIGCTTCSTWRSGRGDVLDVPRRCSRPGRPPTSKLYHQMAAARQAHAHLPPPAFPKGVIVTPSNITSSWFLLLGLPARPVSLTSTINYSLLIQCLPLNFQWLFPPLPSIPPPSGRIYQAAPCTT